MDGHGRDTSSTWPLASGVAATEQMWCCDAAAPLPDWRFGSEDWVVAGFIQKGEDHFYKGSYNKTDYISFLGEELRPRIARNS